MSTRRFLSAIVAGAALFACSGGDDEAKKDGQNGAGGGFVVGVGGIGNGPVGPLDACSGTSREECLAANYAGENLPLDIYIMFDQSCSMSCPAEQTGPGLCCMGGPNPRIDNVRAAVTQFVRDPASAGIGVGIGYFGYMQAGNTSCDPSDYSSADVPIAPLPANADAIVRSVNGADPTGETPTGAAIRGACTYASQYKSQNPGRRVVVLLVTDGFPEAPVTSQNGGCTPSIDDAAQAAASCLSSSANLQTFVVGVGRQLGNLAQIAQAGGTDNAYIVDVGASSASLLQALNQIRAAASIPCQLKIPPAPAGGTINYAQVNLSFCDGQSQSHTFYYVDTAAQCDPNLGGWHYDDASNPQEIILCERSCGDVSIPGGKLAVSVGCDTQILIR